MKSFNQASPKEIVYLTMRQILDSVTLIGVLQVDNIERSLVVIANVFKISKWANPLKPL